MAPLTNSLRMMSWPVWPISRLGGNQNIVLAPAQKGLEMLVIKVIMGLVSVFLYVKLCWSISDFSYLPAEFGALLPLAVDNSFPANHAQQYTSTRYNTAKLCCIIYLTSFFIPQHIVASNPQNAKELTSHIWKIRYIIIQSTGEWFESIFPCQYLCTELLSISSPVQSSLLIILGNTATSSLSPMVMGAFCPGLIFTTEPDCIEKKIKWDSKPTTSHIFF